MPSQKHLSRHSRQGDQGDAERPKISVQRDFKRRRKEESGGLYTTYKLQVLSPKMILQLVRKVLGTNHIIGKLVRKLVRKPCPQHLTDISIYGKVIRKTFKNLANNSSATPLPFRGGRMSWKYCSGLGALKVIKPIVWR